MATRRKKWAGARQDRASAYLLAGLAVTALLCALASWLGGGRGVLVILGAAATVLLPFAALIKWRDFMAGVMRQGPGLRWHVTRDEQPIRFWLVASLGALLVPVGVLLWAAIWWAVFFGDVK